jgi:hypothetical protein
MVDKIAAGKLVEGYINSLYHVEGDTLVVVDEATIGKDYGWIFFYNSRRYLETNNLSYALAGNGPIVVERKDGALTQLGTALPLEESINNYEATRK